MVTKLRHAANSFSLSCPSSAMTHILAHRVDISTQIDRLKTSKMTYQLKTTGEMMSDRKLIAVVGGTGSQGGGLVRAILDDPAREFRVRTLTRNAQSAKARELAAAGAEVVEANLDDGPSVRNAFDGADGAFVVTNYWA